MLSMCKVNRDDHEFLVRIDLKNDGYTESAVMEMSEAEKREHVRRGPIRDDVVRISLIKQLSAESRAPD